jgi:hypothetical protein
MHIVLRHKSLRRALQEPSCIQGGSDEHFHGSWRSATSKCSAKRGRRNKVHSKDQRIKQSTFATNPSFHHIIPYATRDTRIIKVQGRSYPPSRPMPGCMFATSPFNCSITHAEYANFLVEHCRLHASLTTVTLITQTLPSACRISSLLSIRSFLLLSLQIRWRVRVKGRERKRAHVSRPSTRVPIPILAPLRRASRMSEIHKHREAQCIPRHRAARCVPRN